jgi:hypothetical protein
LNLKFQWSRRPGNRLNGAADVKRRGANYSYDCTADAYKQGFLSNCEVGDISGKYGKVLPNHKLKFKRVDISDPVPPLVVDFDKNNAVGAKWASVVFHCGKDKLVCARFKRQPNESEKSIVG